MAQVDRNGGVDREIRVVLDPARLQAQGVTASQVNQQLRQVNVNAAGGRAEIAGSEQSVRVLGNAANAFDLSQTNITVGGGRTVKLADLAKVEDGYAEQRRLAKMNGRQVLSFAISKSKGASEVTVYDAAEKELRKLEKDNPKIKFTQLFTSVDYTKAQYKSAMEAMLEGAVLAVAVVFLFLRDWRATLISAIAIPLSAIPSFWFISLLGFDLNGLVLLALSLVAGVLVDDAIVEIENIVRHMRMGKTAYQASIDAADEIGLAVLATTMSIVAVFLPVGLMPGISGQFFKNFGLTVVVSVLMSLAVARLITPLIAAYFLKSHGSATHGEGWLMDKYMAVLRWSLDERGMERIRSDPHTRLPTDHRVGFGRRAWARLNDHRIWIVGLGALSFVATILMFIGIPVTFQPAANTDYSNVRIELPPGTTLKQTEVITDRVREELAASPIVENAYSRINIGSATIDLTLKKDRKVTSVQFERSWAPRLNEIADARVSFQSQNNGGPGSSGRDITITLGGDDPATLLRTGNAIVAQMQALPELRAPRTSADLVRPEVTIKPRMDLAADLGVTTQALSQTIRIATLGDIDQNSAKFSLSDRQIPIRVQLSEESRRSLATIENLPVPAAGGTSVPLKVIAEVSFGSGPVSIQRTNQIRRLSIGVDLAPGLVDGDVMPKINNLPAMKNLPAGGAKLNLGSAKWQAELFVNFIVAVISGVFLVFAVLVLLYKRVLPPFVNMGSLLLAPLGGALALRLTGTPISMPVFIGMLMLLGIVAKNSILLVDFALEEINKGVDKYTAIIDAGHKRAQPIVMTTIAMVAGHGPGRLVTVGRRQLARADGHRRDRRADRLDHPDAADRPRDVQPGDRHRGLAGPAPVALADQWWRGCGQAGHSTCRIRRPRRRDAAPQSWRGGNEARRHRVAGADGRDLPRPPASSNMRMSAPALSAPLPKRRWSAGWRTGSR